MIGSTSEITDEVSFARQDHHLHLCPQMKQARYSACLQYHVTVLWMFSNENVLQAYENVTSYISVQVPYLCVCVCGGGGELWTACGL